MQFYQPLGILAYKNNKLLDKIYFIRNEIKKILKIYN